MLPPKKNGGEFSVDELLSYLNTKSKQRIGNEEK
jgi:hypothetical protein